MFFNSSVSMVVPQTTRSLGAGQGQKALLLSATGVSTAIHLRTLMESQIAKRVASHSECDTTTTTTLDNVARTGPLITDDADGAFVRQSDGEAICPDDAADDDGQRGGDGEIQLLRRLDVPSNPPLGGSSIRRRSGGPADD